MTARPSVRNAAAPAVTKVSAPFRLAGGLTALLAVAAGAGTNQALSQPATTAPADPVSIAQAATEAMPERRTITIDGRFDDWSGLAPISEGAAPTDATPFLRIGAMWAAFDDEWVYFSWEQSPPANLQGLDGELVLYLDSDGQNWTGATVRPTERADGLFGVDVSLGFSEERMSEDGARGPFTNGVKATYFADEESRAVFNPYALDASFAPTYASERIEMRIRRGNPIPETDQVVFKGDQVSAKLVLRNREGKIEESTHPFLMRFAPAPFLATQVATSMTLEESAPASNEVAAPSTSAPFDPAPSTVLGRVDPTSTRFVSWNVLWGGPFENPAPYARVLNALQPDVICFQEIGREVTTRQIRDWLTQHVPTNFGWEVASTPETGTAIATRLAGVPIGPEQAATTRGERTLRSTMMLVGARGGRRFAVASLHLKCCGRIGDDADQTRIVEAGVVQGLLARALSGHRPSGIVIMGDLNLVGSRTPLDIIRSSNDLDGSDLLDVLPLHIGDTTAVTWSDADQPFLPGRLDFAVVSDATTTVSKSFILNTEELSDAVLQFNRLERTDTSVTSDHFPIVVDLVWK